MAAHLRLHAVTAAAVTTAVLLTRWWATRAVREEHDADGAGAPWRRTVPPPADAQAAPDRVAALHAAYLDPALRETDAHLEQYWKKITSLYPHHDSERPT
ncbi:hypothetical protein [Streptomyces virginiae]|uniref:hypothetical protein n=1 Tax=Streptomyces virginiae TaxID=1961 RepID=UPI00342DBFB5